MKKALRFRHYESLIFIIGFLIIGTLTTLAQNGDVEVEGTLTITESIELGNIFDGNTIVGLHAGQQSAGSQNSFFGFSAGKNNMTGIDNTIFGFSAGENLNNGNRNTYIGSFAGGSNTEGDFNTSLGFSAGLY